MTIQNLDQICLWIKSDEGGYVDDPRDPGGATRYGVTRRVLAAWRGRPVGTEDVMRLTWDEAKKILLAQYLDPIGVDQLPGGLDYCVADAAFNSGPVQAVKWLQRALGVDDDGHLGLVTLRAAAAVKDPAAAVKSYDAERLGFMRHLRTWPVFKNGWLGRVTRVTQRGLELARQPRPVS